MREDGRRDDICAAILRQPGRRYYVIESADGAHYTDITSPKWRSGDGFDRKYLEENGYIQVADTLTELAEKIGISPEHLLQSVNSYHAWKKAKIRLADDLKKLLACMGHSVKPTESAIGGL